MLTTELSKRLFTLKHASIKNYLVVGDENYIKMSQSENTVEFIKKWKRNDEKEGHNHPNQHT